MSFFSQTIERKKKSKAQLQNIFRNRTFIVILLILVCFSLLLTQLFHLQVNLHKKYSTLSDSNRIQLIPMPPTRGHIFDRNGVVLATNIPSFNLTITRQNISRPVDEIIQTLSQWIPISEQEISKYQRIDRVTSRQTAVPIKEQLTEEEINTLAVNLYQLDGVEISSQLTRFYPELNSAVHALGYVGRIDTRDLKDIEEKNIQNQYLTLTHIGKKGAEKSFEDILRGTMGFEEVETNSSGRIIRRLEQTLPTPGQDIYLTLDIRLQRVAEEILGDHTGAIVAFDPKTGEVLAFVSKPDYNPNLFVNGISHTDFNNLNNDPEKPFLNRVMQGRYPPGSTIKPQIALAGLEQGIITPTSTVTCQGFYQVPGSQHKFRDWRKWGHGKVNLYLSLVQSCDVYYYDLAYKMGITPMTDYLKQFSLGTPTGIDLLGESQGVSPTPSYKRKTFNQPWFDGETVTAGIGQSYWLTTPLQINQATTIIAQKGQAFVPHILKATRNPATQELTLKKPVPIAPINVSKSEYWQGVIDGMIGVVHGNQGTARRIAKGINYQIAGKSGTAQVKSIAQNAVYNKETLAKKHHDHAWFTAFAPADNPSIVVTVFIENGNSGSGVAAPLAKEVINAWISDFKTPLQTPSTNTRAGE
ncbi:penicillin-binding protein 2 [Wohlfahrtiimonas larvae]|uniref:Peptidoglycan D,D-transpeptidase MrdA n=1 Tax=Wohlfahrtiimonas larvae TaxID=1157986 RepID=A0ABP9ME49_9GAMM|nr:penicillin-binding protein 2 [Wohlfahrtiimonas larvae]